MSTDLQSAASPADQVAHCRRYAESKGWTVIEDLVVEDAGISGASRHNRPALLALVDQIAEWDVLLCFDWSRIARNTEDLGWLRNRLRLHKRSAYEVSTGLDIDNLGSQVLGMMGEEFLRKLAADTHRGLRGRVERRMHAGGRPYGYRTEAVEGGRALVIDEDQAVNIRRIFAWYADGEGLRGIVARLNREGVTAPRGRSWAFTAVREMIRNPIYRGEYIWNKSEFIKDHETGKRRRIERPESDWLRQHDEAWRIVPEDLWQAVQSGIKARGRTTAGVRDGRGRLLGGVPKVGRGGRPARLLSGFIECGDCGGSFHVSYRDRWACGRRRDRVSGECGNAVEARERDLETRIFGAIESQILQPDHVAYAVEQTTTALRKRLDSGAGNAERRLAEIGRQVDRLLALAERAGDVAELGARLESLEAERQSLLEEAPTMPPVFDSIELRPRI